MALLGGEAADVERARAVLDHLTRRIVHIGPSGAGCAMKLAVNLGMAALSAVACRGDVAPACRRDSSSTRCSTSSAEAPTASPWLKGKLGVLKGEPGDITLDIRTMRKDVMSAIATGARNGVAMPATSGTLASLSAAVAGGWGEGISPRCRAISASSCCRFMNRAGRTASRLLPS